MFKLTKEETVDLCMELYLKGYNCGEATITAMVHSLGIETDLFPRGGTAFGGGFGGEHLHQCGVISSGILATGFAFGRNNPVEESRERAYTLATLYYNDFKDKFKCVNCHELVGLPAAAGDAWNIPYKAQNKRQERCEHFVRYGVGRWYELAQEVLEGRRLDYYTDGQS